MFLDFIIFLNLLQMMIDFIPGDFFVQIKYFFLILYLKTKEIEP